MARLPVTIELYITVLALVSGPVIIANQCCVPPAVQRNCSDMYGVDGNEEPCYIYRYLSRKERHACPLLLPPTSDSPHPSTFSSSVEITKTEISYHAACQTTEECTFNEHKMADCSELSGGWTHIALHISYKIHGSGFQGVMFNLTTDFEQEFVSLNKSCHYVCLDNQITPRKFTNKIFTYSGYVGLHPGATYNLTATALYSSNTTSNTETVQVRNCNYFKLQNRQDVCDYFCNLRSPANNSRERWMSLGSDLSAWFEVLPWEEDKITSFNVTLKKKKGTKWWTESELIANNKENTVDWEGLIIIKHQFVGSGPGDYKVQVFGQPDSVCLNDMHWQRNCSASSTTETVTPAVRPMSPTTVTSTLRTQTIGLVSIFLIVGVVVSTVVITLIALYVLNLCRGNICEILKTQGNISLHPVSSNASINRYEPRLLESFRRIRRLDDCSTIFSGQSEVLSMEETEVGEDLLIATSYRRELSSPGVEEYYPMIPHHRPITDHDKDVERAAMAPSNMAQNVYEDIPLRDDSNSNVGERNDYREPDRRT